jgi:hypothetical protein
MKTETCLRDRAPPATSPPRPLLTNPEPPVRCQHAATAVIIIRPIVISGPRAGEEKASVKAMVKAIVMKPAETREGVAAEPVIGERMPGKCLRSKRVTAERTVTAEATVTGKATVTAATVTTSAAVTASATMCHGAVRPYRCAERNRRRERSVSRRPPHERLSFFPASELFRSQLSGKAPNL